MEQLHELMSTRLQAAIDEGKLTDLMDKHITEMLNSLIREQLRCYSDTSKALEAKIKESMAGAIERISFPEYSKYVADLVVREYGNALSEDAAALFRKQIGDKLDPAPEQMTADDFFEGVKRALSDSAEHGEIEMDWRISEDEEAIRLTIGERHSKYMIVFYSFINCDQPGHAIGYIKDDGGNSLTIGVSGATHATHGLDNYLYRLYCSKTEITDLLDWDGCNLQMFED
jgi:hypothetical protein